MRIGAQILLVDGNIGVGKTKLLEHIAEYWQEVTGDKREIIILPEIVEENPLFPDYLDALDRFYNEDEPIPNNIGFNTQLIFLINGYRQLKEAHRTAQLENALIIKDRSYMGDMVFCQKLKDDLVIPEHDFITYERIFGKLSPDLDVSLFMYLRAKTTTLMDRIAHRGRIGEEAYDEEYIDDLTVRHDQIFDDYPGKKLKLQYDMPNIFSHTDREEIFLKLFKELNGI